MSSLNNPIPSNGQQFLHQKSSATQDACQHPSMAQSVQGARTLKQFRSNSSAKKLTVHCQQRSSPWRGDIHNISDVVGPKKEEFQFAPVAQSCLYLLSDNEKYVPIDGAMGDLDHGRISSKPSIVLAVSVSSAVKLEAGQVELIARKMQKLTGFRNLRLENTVDPSLIAGFTISYGDDESNVIDLSVKGQLASLAARVESSERRTANNEQSWEVSMSMMCFRETSTWIDGVKLKDRRLEPPMILSMHLQQNPDQAHRSTTQQYGEAVTGMYTYRDETCSMLWLVQL